MFCEKTEQESKKVTEQDLPKLIKTGFGCYGRLNTTKIIEILIHWRI